jgi:predicted ABC-type ATPase
VRWQNSDMGHERKIIIVAGPNGAGKTTFAREFLPREADCPVFINADLIAAGLSPFRPEAAAVRAGRLLLTEIATRVERRESFAFESTLSGRSYARSIPRWKTMGYHIKIIFLSLPTVEIAIARVAARVAQGGHDVPAATIRRRFKGGYVNFTGIYRPLADAWVLYDNSGETPLLIESGERK